MTNIDFDPELDELERLSNSVVDHIQGGALEAAERGCRELERRFPDQIDWLERTAMLHAARGEVGPAIEHYRRCITFIESNPDGFDEEAKDGYRAQIDGLSR